jgi:hypothetical protein
MSPIAIKFEKARFHEKQIRSIAALAARQSFSKYNSAFWLINFAIIVPSHNKLFLVSAIQ